MLRVFPEGGVLLSGGVQPPRVLRLLHAHEGPAGAERVPHLSQGAVICESTITGLIETLFVGIGSEFTEIFDFEYLLRSISQKCFFFLNKINFFERTSKRFTDP